MSVLSLDGRAYIPFKGCAKPTLGIELELQIINPETQNLQSGSLEIMRQVNPHPHIKPELTQSTIEVITGICDCVGTAREDLTASLRTLYAIGDVAGFTFAAAGTHPFGRWSEQQIYPNERYQALVERIQWAARRLTIYGMHVHVGVSSGERAIAISNALTTFLPHMLALSASSPFVDAEDSGLCSCRVKLFESMPTAGLPYRLANYGEFQSFMNSLIRAGAIESIREIWWDIRPHPSFGTIEVRICDMPSTLTEACSLAAFIQSLVVYLDRLYERGYFFDLLDPWIVRENKWRAARFGLDAHIVTDNRGTQASLRDEIEQVLERLAPTAHELDCAAELGALSRILTGGNSSMRQRQLFRETHDLKEVVRSLTDQLRADALPARQVPAARSE